MPSSSTHCRSPSIIITEEDEDLDNGIGMEEFGSKDVVLRHHVKVARDERQLLTRDDQQTDKVRLYSIPVLLCKSRAVANNKSAFVTTPLRRNNNPPLFNQSIFIHPSLISCGPLPSPL